MSARRFALIAAALLPAAALAVHELRYRLAFGDDTGSVLAEHGHGYLSVLSPVAVLLCAAGCARLLLSVAQGLPDRTPRAGLPQMWLASAGALFTIYASQELLEGMLSPGHAAGLDAIFAGSGWLAAPLSVLVGLALALVLRLARAVAQCRAQRHVVRVALRSPNGLRATSAIVTPRACLLARRLAGRAPPLTA
jgi:hypothetical protein